MRRVAMKLNHNTKDNESATEVRFRNLCLVAPYDAETAIDGLNSAIWRDVP
jgi:hypothetical protein